MAGRGDRVRPRAGSSSAARAVTGPPRRARAALGLLGLLLSAGCAIPRWPVEGPLTSAFGVRFRGVLPEIHRGVDIAVPAGTRVRPMAPGRVRWAGTMEGFGRVVWVEHGGSVITVYAHLSRIDVRTGQRVDRDDLLGLTGRSGEAAGAHLHFEIWRWGREVDPVPLLGGRPAG